MSLTPPTRLPVALQPRPEPMRYGLFRVAPPQALSEAALVDSGITDPNFRDHAFGSGFYYDPIGCGRSRLYPVECPDEEPPPEKEFDDNSPEIPVLPFVVYSTLVCGMPSAVRYYTDKNIERLHATEQEAVEDALWTGAAGNGPWLADPAGPYGAPVDVGAGGSFADIVDAVSALEQYAYGTARYGFHATLHAQTAVHAYAAADHLIETAQHGFSAAWGVSANDTALRTPLGTKWVFGGGYPGTGPAGAAPDPGQTYIWITGLVSVWRDDVWLPGEPLRTQFDRSLNELRLIAERRYLATFDCFSAYALVDIPDPAVVPEP